MKEKLQRLGRILIAHADRTATATLGIILLLLIGLYLAEQARSETPPTELGKKEFVEQIPNENYDKFASNFINVNEDISKDPQVAVITEFNMFDLKSVKAQEELAKQMDTQVDEAERLIKLGNKEEALKLLNSVLGRKSDHVRAIDLKNQIEPPPSPTATAPP